MQDDSLKWTFDCLTKLSQSQAQKFGLFHFLVFRKMEMWLV